MRKVFPVIDDLGPIDEVLCSFVGSRLSVPDEDKVKVFISLHSI